MRMSLDEVVGRRSVGDRLLLILDTVAAAPGEVGLSELARLTGLKKPTVHRLASDLLAKRLLDRGTYGYRLGMHLFELGQQVPASRRVRDAALPAMVGLLDSTRESVQLAVLDGADVVVVEQFVRSARGAVARGAGSRLPAYCSGLGKAILAFSAPAVVVAALASSMPARTGTTITGPERLRRELAGVREAGVAFDRQECVGGIVCAAAPIVVANRGARAEDVAVAAVAVSGPSRRMPVVRVEAAVRAAAFAISRALTVPVASVRGGDEGR